VPVHGGLHLKTCITALDQETFVLNRNWLDATAFEKFRLVEVVPDEPWAGNTLTVNGVTLLNAAYPCTAEKIEALGYECVRLDISEFAKAEAGLTCMSLIFNDATTTP
jgi:dimethylargininase